MAEQIAPSSIEPQSLPPEAAEPIEFSPETMQASKNIVDMQLNENTTNQADVLVDSMVKDLKSQGISLDPEEKKRWGTRVKEMFSPPKPEGTKTVDATKIDLREYQRVLGDVHKTYGMGKHAVSLGAIESVIVAHKLVDSIASVGTSVLMWKAWDKVNTNIYQKHLNKMLGFAGTGKFMDEFSIHDVLTDVAHLAPKTPRELVNLAKKQGWPVRFALAKLPLSVSEQIMPFVFEKHLLATREAINQRTAQSIFMRDFEFIHDASAVELLDIIERGKKGVLDLLSATYMEVVPHAAVVVTTALPQFLTSPLMAFASILRIPFLIKTTEKLSQEILTSRRAQLAHKTAIDQRVATTLASIEIVKTSPSITEATAELEKTMKERDAFHLQTSEAELKHMFKSSILAQLFEFGIPAVGALENLVRGKKKQAIASGLVGMFLAGKQRNSAEAIASIFAEKIQPAIQDIKRMEEFLGPYDQVDTPDGAREKARMAVDGLNNFDISVKNLSFKDILHDVSLDIPQGAFVTIKGPSGIGKTTFFRHLMGLYGAPEGSVQYGSVDLQNIKKFGEQSIYSKIAYANQNPQFFENMTLRDNLLLWTKKPATDIEIRQTLNDLRLDGLIDRLDSKVKHYSGGELRRIGIARALLKDPRVLFLDEPTANLDQESAKQVLEIIKGLREKRKDMTVVAVTHDPMFEAIAEKIVDFKEINKKPAEQVWVGSSVS